VKATNVSVVPGSVAADGDRPGPAALKATAKIVEVRYDATDGANVTCRKATEKDESASAN